MMQMPKCAKISSDFICIYEKIAGGRGSAPDSCCLSLYLNIADVRQGPGNCFWGPGQVLEIFVTKSTSGNPDSYSCGTLVAIGRNYAMYAMRRTYNQCPK